MEDTKHIKISEFNYPLPDERIAKFPLSNRDESKLLVYRHGEVSEDRFTSLPSYLEPGEMMVFNNLVLRAMQELGITGLENLMEGPNAFVFGTGDVTDAPKVINQFIEKNKLQSLEIKGGLMGEEVLDAKGVKAIAALPGREELLATLVGCLVSPVSSLVAVLDEIAEKKAA